MNETEELKTRLMKDVEAIIDRMLATRPSAEEITLRYVEKTAVAAGEKVKEVIAQELLASGEEAAREVCCPSCGKRLGMKDYCSRRVVTEAGEIQIRRAYYYCKECHQGVFPPG